MVSYNDWPVNGDKNWGTLILNAYSILIPSKVGALDKLKRKYKNKERSWYRAILEKYNLFSSCLLYTSPSPRD